MTENIVAMALELATKAHGEIKQKRKYTGEPYIVHPAEVALMVRQYGGSAEMIAAAWLHDVVEDTPVTMGQIYAQFGAKVGLMVEQLTNITVPSDGNRNIRKSVEADRLGLSTPQVKTIKCCDLMDNTVSICKHDPEFGMLYLQEKDVMLDELRGAWPDAWRDAARMLRREAEKLNVKLRYI